MKVWMVTDVRCILVVGFSWWTYLWVSTCIISLVLFNYSIGKISCAFLCKAQKSAFAHIAIFCGIIENYVEFKEKVKNDIIDTLSVKFIPNIRDHIDVIQFWSPLDLANEVKTPCGALYGMRPDMRKLVWPVGNNSPLKNLYFVGATASFAGLGPVINGSMKLFDMLHSKDRVAG